MDAERQIAHHARIGGIVAVFVSIAELAIAEWIHQAYDLYPLWTVFGGLLAILAMFFAVFFVIRSYERWWHSKEVASKEKTSSQPIKLRKSGVVDGIWVDAIYDISTRQRVEGSVIKIESSGAGFTVEGWAYESEDIEKTANVSEIVISGHFSGNGRHWYDDGFVCVYEGKKGIAQRDKGAVVYEFTTLGGKRTMSGVFFGFGLKTAYYLQGKRVDVDTKNLSSDLRREKLWLRDFLKEQPKPLKQ